MIEKIIEIKNIGHFVNFKSHGTRKWNGQLRKLNIIYAPNGSGKTTLSTILKSLAQNNLSFINFKKTIGSSGEPKVILKEKDNSSLIILDNKKWSINNLKLEVFDINYVEDYLFSGSYNRKQNKTNLYKLLLGTKGMEYRKLIKLLINKRDQMFNEMIPLGRNPSFTRIELDKVINELEILINEFKDYSQTVYKEHIKIINQYLERFTSYIRLLEFRNDNSLSSFEFFRIYPVFEVYDAEVIFSSPDPSNKIGNAKYSLSEGDKSTIALCFFLARLEIQGVSDKVIVFDDPLSSFDYSRRSTTIFQLSKIANKAIQFILLTHDLGFANDFKDKCAFLDYINLKIENDGETSYLSSHDIDSEFLTSTQKDLEVIKDYLIKPAVSEYDKREVVRCIRPVLEGVFKSKYFDLIDNNVWLGEIIEKIKKSKAESRLYKLNDIIDNVIELNDYTKSFHHATSANKNENINSIELRRYITLLMSTIDKI